MNFRAVLYILGWILNIEGALMLAPFLVSLAYGEPQGAAFAAMAAICVAIGTLIVFKRPKNMTFFAREGFAVTALAWMLLSLFGCFPFII